MKTVSVNFMVWILLFSRTSGILFGFSMVINLRGFDRSIGVDVTSSAEFLIAAFPCLKFLRHFMRMISHFQPWFGFWRLSISEGFHISSFLFPAFRFHISCFQIWTFHFGELHNSPDFPCLMVSVGFH